jgi:hypothetical protein
MNIELTDKIHHHEYDKISVRINFTDGVGVIVGISVGENTVYLKPEEIKEILTILTKFEKAVDSFVEVKR